MNEDLFLKKFAKALGAEDTLTKIEQKKINEEKMLKGMAKLLGTEDLLKEIESKKAKEKALAEEKQRIEAELAEEKRRKEEELLQMLNLSLGNLITNNKDQVPTIEQELNKVIPFVNHPDKNVTDEMVVIVSDGVEPKQIKFEDLQPQPELPDDFVTSTVKTITKNAPTIGQTDVDGVPDAFKKELDLIKKSIADLHRFASRHSQHGGGGEVNLRYLDDIDRSTIMDGLFLKYDAASKKFVFGSATGSSSSIEALTNVEVDNKVEGAVLQYSLIDDKYHVKPLTITSDMSASIDAGDF